MRANRVGRKEGLVAVEGEVIVVSTEWARLQKGGGGGVHHHHKQISLTVRLRGACNIS